jgi:hypothetical protein
MYDLDSDDPLEEVRRHPASDGCAGGEFHETRPPVHPGGARSALRFANRRAPARPGVDGGSWVPSGHDADALCDVPHPGRGRHPHRRGAGQDQEFGLPDDPGLQLNRPSAHKPFPGKPPGGRLSF